MQLPTNMKQMLLIIIISTLPFFIVAMERISFTNADAASIPLLGHNLNKNPHFETYAKNCA